MRTVVYPANRLILVGSKMIGFTSVKNSLADQENHKIFHSLEDIKIMSGDEWYRCLKVGIVRNPYDLAVSLHFWYQQEETARRRSRLAAESVGPQHSAGR